MLEDLNAALDEVERAIGAGEPVDVAALARRAATSEHHLRRMFSSLAGLPLGEYVRRRRMTVAAADVLDCDLSLLDVAVRHGYSSTESFTRAFRAVHGVGAGEARRARPALESQARVSFHLTVRGRTSLRYRIVHKSAFRLVGRRTRVPLVHLGPNPAIQDFVRGLGPAVREQVGAMSDQEPSGALSVADALEEPRTEGSGLDYWYACATSRRAPEGLEELDVAAGTWVVLTSTGPYPETLQQMWREAYGEWFPSNPWRTRPGPELLRTELRPDRTADGELWLPVEAPER